MKQLISGQTIELDNHDRGSGKEVTFDDNLHIHKRMNNDRYSGAEILVPLNLNRNVQIRKVSGSTKIKDKIIKEVNKVFKNKRKRVEFARYISKQIDRYSSGFNEVERIENLVSGAQGIANHFELDTEVLNEFRDLARDRIVKLTTEHEDEFGKKFYIMQDTDSKSIKIGSDLSILDEWDNIIKLLK